MRLTRRERRALQAELAGAGVTASIDDVLDLIDGVAAAPPGHDPEAWLALVAHPLPPPLKTRLMARLHEARAAQAPTPPDPEGRLALLRTQLRRRRLAGVLVPRGDEHQGEYVPGYSERLAWLTGFSGSAGLAIVLVDRAAMFIDGRYTVQVRQQVPEALFEFHHIMDSPPARWIARFLPAGSRLAYDPWLLTPNQVANYTAACEAVGGRFTPVTGNLVDAVWRGRPPPPIAPVYSHGIAFSGRTSSEKRHDVAARLIADTQDATVLSAPDSIAWLLNIRGGDVPHAPLPLAFAILRANTSVQLFLDPRKLTAGVASHLGDDVSVAAPGAMAAALDQLGAERRLVRIDPDGTPDWVVRRLKRAGARIARGADPCARPKAVKNAVELDGIRAAHRRDGAALAGFLAWLDREAPSGLVTEADAADRIDAFRSAADTFRGASFPTISAAGPNGAVVHYRVGADTDRHLEPGGLYLVDSGGQYPDGTTDVTRTIAIGAPSDEMRQRFTRVLKGHIAIATTRFPKGTTGSQLDTLARLALWDAGLDYDHGTGHGVGAYLSVHEGPQRISKQPNRVALEAGMIVSNEPGYYRNGVYGIRIENLVAVVPAPAPAGAEKELLGFETLTLAPIDRSLVDPTLLTAEEIHWLDTYHASVQSTIGPLIDPDTRDWLAHATRPLGADRAALGAANGGE